MYGHVWTSLFGGSYRCSWEEIMSLEVAWQTTAYLCAMAIFGECPTDLGHRDVVQIFSTCTSANTHHSPVIRSKWHQGSEMEAKSSEPNKQLRNHKICVLTTFFCNTCEDKCLT